jgi:hypothetical protein
MHVASRLLMFVVVFISSGLQYMAAGTGFVCRKSPGLSGASSHEYENFYPFPTVGAFYFRQSWGVLSFVAAIQQHGNSSCVFLQLTIELPELQEKSRAEVDFSVGLRYNNKKQETRR